MAEYNVTKEGNVINIKTGNQLKLRINRKTGYSQVNLHINMKQITYNVHRLVAEKYIPNPDNKLTINHINGIKTDNRVENLEWISMLENNRHARSTGLMNQNGEDSVRAKLTEKEVLEIRAKYIPRIYTHRMLAEEYNVDEEQIRRIILRQRWKHI